jgi:hypothetical protein
MDKVIKIEKATISNIYLNKTSVLIDCTQGPYVASILISNKIFKQIFNLKNINKNTIKALINKKINVLYKKDYLCGIQNLKNKKSFVNDHIWNDVEVVEEEINK